MNWTIGVLQSKQSPKKINVTFRVLYDIELPTAFFSSLYTDTRLLLETEKPKVHF